MVSLLLDTLVVMVPLSICRGVSEDIFDDSFRILGLQTKGFDEDVLKEGVW